MRPRSPFTVEVNAAQLELDRARGSGPYQPMTMLDSITLRDFIAAAPFNDKPKREDADQEHPGGAGEFGLNCRGPESSLPQGASPVVVLVQEAGLAGYWWPRRRSWFWSRRMPQYCITVRFEPW